MKSVVYEVSINVKDAAWSIVHRKDYADYTNWQINVMSNVVFNHIWSNIRNKTEK